MLSCEPPCGGSTRIQGHRKIGAGKYFKIRRKLEQRKRIVSHYTLNVISHFLALVPIAQSGLLFPISYSAAAVKTSLRIRRRRGIQIKENNGRREYAIQRSIAQSS